MTRDSWRRVEVQVFEADGFGQADGLGGSTADLRISTLDWNDVGAAPSDDTGWALRSSQFAVLPVALGVRFEVFDRRGDQIGGGWRPTVSGAKRAAKRRIRRRMRRNQRRRR
jgi:hypothetical protein